MLPDNTLTTINVPSSDLWGNHKNKKAKVDIYIADAIQLLNDKGYKTICCCSGHAYRRLDGRIRPGMDGYIWFDCYIDSAPNGWYLDDHKMPTGGDCIRYETNRLSKTILRKKMAKLMRWVKSLPVKES